MKTTAAPTIDIRKVKMVKLDAKGKELRASAKNHHAIKLPQFGLIFPNIDPIACDNWKAGLKAGKDFKLFGKKCVTPEASELSLLIDRSQSGIKVDAGFFPKLHTRDWYWTATEYVSSSPSDFAYYVYFHYGSVSWYYQSSTGLVLPVLRVASKNASKP